MDPIAQALDEYDKKFPKKVCSYCDASLDGTYRYRCLECGDYNLCWVCFEDKEDNEFHKLNHAVARFDENEELFGMKFEPKNLHLRYMIDKFAHEIHDEFTCKSCGMSPIEGVRFKCASCLNCNLCINCKHNHPSEHSLIIYPKTISTVINKEDVVITETDLGEGSFGHVFEGIFNGNRVACKTIKINDNQGELDVKSHMREIDALNEIRCENILRFFGYYQDLEKNEFIIVTEIMSKGDLAYVLDQEPELPFETRFSIANDVACGMFRMHQMHFVHRDLRPSNIFITENYQAKIGDMGKAKYIETDIQGTADSKEGKIESFGNARYKPPEMYDKKRFKLNIKVDIFSFGLTLNEIFGGKHVRVKTEIEVTIAAPDPIWDMAFKYINKNPDVRHHSGEIHDKFLFLHCKLKESIQKDEKYSEPGKSYSERVENFKVHLQEALKLYDDKLNAEEAKLRVSKNGELMKFYKKQLNHLETLFNNFDCFELADCYDNIGEVYYQMNDSEQSLNFYKKALEMRQRILDSGDGDPFTANFDLSISYEKMVYVYVYLLNDEKTNEEKAFELNKLAISKRNEMLGEDAYKRSEQYVTRLTTSIAVSMKLMGDCYLKKGDHQTALKHYLDALRMRRERCTGDENLFNMFYILESIEICYSLNLNEIKTEETIKEANEYVREGLKIKRQLFEKKHPRKTFFNSVLLTKNYQEDKFSWDYVLLKDDDFKSSEDRYIELLRHGEDAEVRASDYGTVIYSGLGESPPIQVKLNILNTFQDFKPNLRLDGLPSNLEDDESFVLTYLYKQLTDELQFTNCSSDQYVLKRLMNISYYFLEQNYIKASLKYANVCLEISKLLFEGDHQLKADCLSLVGNCYLYPMNQAGQSLRYCLEALDMRRRLFKNRDHIKLAQSLTQAGTALFFNGVQPLGLTTMVEGAEMRKRLIGSNTDKLLVKDLERIAKCYSLDFDPEKCQYYAAEALERRKARFEQMHPGKKFGRVVQLTDGGFKGRPAWHYIFVQDEEKYKELMAKYNSGESLMIVQGNYGEILEQGWGIRPPKEIHEKMEKLYGPF